MYCLLTAQHYFIVNFQTYLEVITSLLADKNSCSLLRTWTSMSVKYNVSTVSAQGIIISCKSKLNKFNPQVLYIEWMIVVWRHGENKLYFNEMMSTLSSLKQSIGRHVAPLMTHYPECEPTSLCSYSLMLKPKIFLKPI